MSQDYYPINPINPTPTRSGPVHRDGKQDMEDGSPGIQKRGRIERARPWPNSIATSTRGGGKGGGVELTAEA